jgi:hypothetical protein
LTLWAEERLPARGKTAPVVWPGVAVAVKATSATGGTASIAWALESGADEVRWTWSAPAFGPHPESPGDGSASRLPVLVDPLNIPVTVSGSGGDTTFIPRELPLNKRQALADAFAVQASGTLWEQTLKRMGCGGNMVTEPQEAQTTMTRAPRWAEMWASLAWEYVWGLDLTNKRRDLLVAFLRQSNGSSYERIGLMERVNELALMETASAAPNWEGLGLMVRRVRELGLPEDWWAVQNLIWDKRLHTGDGRAFAALIGFAV